MSKQGITAEQALYSKKDFYAKKWQQNGFYPIDKFVYHAENDCYEQFVQKTSGWKSYGIAYEKPTICAVDGGKEIEITNRSWWQYIFEHSSYILSFSEMSDNYSYDLK